MLEYAVVNFCQFNYFLRQKQINEIINNVGAKLSKFKKKLEKTQKQQMISDQIFDRQQKIVHSRNLSKKMSSFFSKKSIIPEQPETEENGLNTEGGLIKKTSLMTPAEL